MSCRAKRLVCCFEDQGHSDGSDLHSLSGLFLKLFLYHRSLRSICKQTGCVEIPVLLLVPRASAILITRASALLGPSAVLLIIASAILGPSAVTLTRASAVLANQSKCNT